MWHHILIGMVVLGTVFSQKKSKLSTNPCPSVLSYDEDTDGTLHATIVVPNDVKKVPKMEVGASYVGTFDDDTKPKLILDLPMKENDLLEASELTYKLTSTRSDLMASITQIKLNGKVYCRGPSEPLSSTEFTEMWVYKEGILPSVFCSELALCIQTKSTSPVESLTDHSWTIVQDENEKIDTQKTSRKSTPNDLQCGLSKRPPNPVYSNRTTVEKYEFPWLVALFRLYDRNYKFGCTASLLDHKHVITVASCLRHKRYYDEENNLDVESEKILLVFGISNIYQWAKKEDAVLREVSEVLIHPDFEYGRARGDIAVLTLSKSVEYSEGIKPICLLDRERCNDDNPGIVAGWSKEVMNAEKINMSVVYELLCPGQRPSFCTYSEYPFSRHCTVNKGAPFMADVDGRWYLRGMVSQTDGMVVTKECYSHFYKVFPDLPYYYAWILETLNSNSK